jgi:hypothetical protein
MSSPMTMWVRYPSVVSGLAIPTFAYHKLYIFRLNNNGFGPRHSIPSRNSQTIVEVFRWCVGPLAPGPRGGWKGCPD